MAWLRVPGMAAALAFVIVMAGERQSHGCGGTYVLIQGKHIASSGLKGRSGNYYTDYTVRFTAGSLGSWVEKRRAYGGRSWYGWYWSKQVWLSCEDVAAGRVPKGVPKGFKAVLLKARGKFVKKHCAKCCKTVSQQLRDKIQAKQKKVQQREDLKNAMQTKKRFLDAHVATQRSEHAARGVAYKEGWIGDGKVRRRDDRYRDLKGDYDRAKRAYQGQVEELNRQIQNLQNEIDKLRALEAQCKKQAGVK